MALISDKWWLRIIAGIRAIGFGALLYGIADDSWKIAVLGLMAWTAAYIEYETACRAQPKEPDNG
jgi:hypothetical protein